MPHSKKVKVRTWVPIDLGEPRVINEFEYLLETGKKLEEEEDESGGQKTTLNNNRDIRNLHWTSMATET